MGLDSQPISGQGSVPAEGTSGVGGHVQGGHPGGDASAKKIQISSLQDLRREAPEVYRQMMLGIGTKICRDMQKGQARIKAAMRKAREIR